VSCPGVTREREKEVESKKEKERNKHIGRRERTNESWEKGKEKKKEIKILWHVDPLLGDDSEIGVCTTAFARERLCEHTRY
jgi:hypothetical protein